MLGAIYRGNFIYSGVRGEGRGQEGPREKALQTERRGCVQIPERPRETKIALRSRRSMISDEAENPRGERAT